MRLVAVGESDEQRGAKRPYVGLKCDAAVFRYVCQSELYRPARARQRPPVFNEPQNGGAARCIHLPISADGNAPGPAKEFESVGGKHQSSGEHGESHEFHGAMIAHCRMFRWNSKRASGDERAWT